MGQHLENRFLNTLTSLCIYNIIHKILFFKCHKLLQMKPGAAACQNVQDN